MAVNYTGQDSGYEIYMRPYYAKALVHIIQHLGWDAMVFMYDEDEGIYIYIYFMLRHKSIYVQKCRNSTFNR